MQNVLHFAAEALIWLNSLNFLRFFARLGHFSQFRPLLSYYSIYLFCLDNVRGRYACASHRTCDDR